MKYEPFVYQRRAIKRLINDAYVGLWLRPGRGKTSITLAAVTVAKRRKERVAALTIAPLQVLKTSWPDEIEKWDQFNGITYAILHGPKKSATLDKAIRDDVDLFLINPEGLVWLREELVRRQKFIFNWLILDEATLFKNSKTKRWKLLAKWRRLFSKRITLTGTPASNGLLDIFGHSAMLDMGESLEGNFYKFRKKYFFAIDRDQFIWVPFPDSDQKLVEAVAPFTLRVSSEEERELPPLTYNEIKLKLPLKTQRMYFELSSKMITVAGEEKIIAGSKGVLGGKLSQITNGAIYLRDILTKQKKINAKGDDFEELHNAKIDALRDLYEELSGSPLLVFTEFVHDTIRIKRAFPDALVLGIDKIEPSKMVKDWNAGKIQMLVGNPRPIARGLNLQHGPCQDMCWFGLTHSLDIFDQAIQRLHRHGQVRAITVHMLLIENSVDYIMKLALQNKGITETKAMDMLLEQNRILAKRLKK